MLENADINNFARRFITEVQETQEQFIFTTLSNFVERNYQLIVEKDELTKAIQLIRMCEEHNINIFECYGNIVHSITDSDAAYGRGYEAGKKEAYDEIKEALMVLGPSTLVSCLEKAEEKTKRRLDDND